MSGRKTERGIFRVLTMAVCVLASAAVCLNTGISAVRADAADGGRTAVMSEAAGERVSSSSARKPYSASAIERKLMVPSSNLEQGF